MCVTIVGQVSSVDEQRGEAIVVVRGAPMTVSVAPLVLEGAPPRCGDWVLVHTGLAVATIDEREAKELEALVLDLQREEP